MRFVESSVTRAEKEWDEKDERKNGKEVKEVQKKFDPLFFSFV